MTARRYHRAGAGLRFVGTVLRATVGHGVMLYNSMWGNATAGTARAGGGQPAWTAMPSASTKPFAPSVNVRSGVAFPDA